MMIKNAKNSFRNIILSVMGVLILSCAANGQWIRMGSSTCALDSLSGQEVFAAGSGSDLFAGSNCGVFYSNNDGEQWAAVNNGLPDIGVTSLAVSGANLFAGTDGSGIYRSIDNGSNWTAVNNGLMCLHVLRLMVSGANIFAATTNDNDRPYLYLSTNSGTNWIGANNGLDDIYVTALAVSGTNLFAGTFPGTYGSGVYLSTNTGSSWTTVNNELTNNPVTALATSGTTVFAGTYGGVYRSSNNGTSWTAVNNGLTDNNIRAFAVNGINIFVGTYSGGVFLSNNNGATWTAVNDGLPRYSLLSIVILGTNLYAGTENGIWKRPLNEMITVEKPVIGQNTRTVSLRNYPNPFKSSTAIKYLIPEGQKGRLYIYSCTGAIIMSKGVHGCGTIRWEITGKSAGIYLAKLQIGQDIFINKMLVIP
jgi:photosystem II stability/assembly factor-like uncharacterized protein